MSVFQWGNENAWTTNAEYYSPLPGFNRSNRDIDIRAIRGAYDWHFSDGWEFQLGLLAIRATGTRTVPSLAPTVAQEPSNAWSLGIGPLFRWNFLELSRRWRFFADGELDPMLSNRPFPADGTRNAFFLGGGDGASIRLFESYWLEASYRRAHVSNGRGFESGNPQWDGQGIEVGLRYVVHRAPATAKSEGSDKAWLPVFCKADENAWITSAAYYAPLPGFNREHRDIDIRMFSVDRAWRFRNGLEFQFGGLTLKSNGAFGAGLGPLLRWNFLARKQFRAFVDGEPDFVFSNGAIPAGGTKNNFLLRGGGGVSVRLQKSYWLEASFRRAHITNAQGSGGGNPGWSGQGVSLSLRHTLD